MDYQILFTDLDGTLLNSRSKILASTKKAVADATKAGKRVVLCSGRSWMSLEYYEQALGLYAPGFFGCAFNGGIVYETYTTKFLFERPMDNALGLDVARALKLMNADIIMYANNELLADRDTPDLKYYTDKSRIKARFVRDFSEVTGDIAKIIIRGRNEALLEIAKSMTALFDGRCNVFFSSEDLLEFAHPDTHKGRSVEFLADYLHIPLSAVIAMGDEANDISMLETAGLGIAVANAVPAAKAAADIVLRESCDEDAVGRVIREYLL